jgi:hypothetical protein
MHLTSKLMFLNLQSDLIEHVRQVQRGLMYFLFNYYYVIFFSIYYVISIFQFYISFQNFKLNKVRLFS